MWILVAGRMSQPMAEEMRQVSGIPIIGVENVGDLCYTLEVQGNGAFQKVVGAVVVDPSIDSLKDWGGVRVLANRLPHVDVHIVNRFPKLSPSLDMFPQNVQVHSVEKEGQVAISQLLRVVVDGEETRKALESVKELEKQMLGEDGEQELVASL